MLQGHSFCRAHRPLPPGAPLSWGEIVALRQLSFRIAQRLMGDDICQHITEDNKIRSKGGQFFFRQTFTEFAGDGGEIEKVGTVIHTYASVQSLLYHMQGSADRC